MFFGQLVTLIGFAALGQIEDQAYYKRCPPCLMACANSCSCVAVEVLVKRQEITPVGICLE